MNDEVRLTKREWAELQQAEWRRSLDVEHAAIQRRAAVHEQVAAAIVDAFKGGVDYIRAGESIRIVIGDDVGLWLTADGIEHRQSVGVLTI